MSRLRERTLLWCSWGGCCMGTLSGVALCSRGVDLLIFGISAAVSMQAAATLRNPERLIPALPPQRTHSAGGDGEITERESTPPLLPPLLPLPPMAGFRFLLPS